MRSENLTQAAGPRDLDIWTTQGELETKQVDRRNERTNDWTRRSTHWTGRFGPMPGEVYPDEAHFGSFS
jgi:hypothetical protein